MTSIYKSNKQGDREKALWLRALATLPEDVGSVSHNPLNSDSTFLWLLCVLHTHVVQAQVQAKHSYT